MAKMKRRKIHCCDANALTYPILSWSANANDNESNHVYAVHTILCPANALFPVQITQFRDVLSIVHKIYNCGMHVEWHFLEVAPFHSSASWLCPPLWGRLLCRYGIGVAMIFAGRVSPHYEPWRLSLHSSRVGFQILRNRLSVSWETVTAPLMPANFLA